MNLTGNQDLGGKVLAAGQADPNSARGQFFTSIAPLVASSQTPVSMSDITAAFNDDRKVSLQQKLDDAQISNIHSEIGERSQQMQQRGLDIQTTMGMSPQDRTLLAQGARPQLMYNPNTNSFRMALQPQGDEVPSGGPQLQQGMQQTQVGGMNLQTLQSMSLDERKDTAMGAKPQVFYSPSHGTSRLGTRPQGDEVTQEQAPKMQDFYNPTTRTWSQGVTAPPGALPGDVARFMLQLPIQYQGIYQKAYSDYINAYKASSHMISGRLGAEELDTKAQQAAMDTVNQAMTLGTAKGDTTSPVTSGFGGVNAGGGGAGAAGAAAPGGVPWWKNYGG
jgi:hypothetical protein